MTHEITIKDMYLLMLKYNKHMQIKRVLENGNTIYLVRQILDIPGAKTIGYLSDRFEYNICKGLAGIKGRYIGPDIFC